MTHGEISIIGTHSTLWFPVRVPGRGYRTGRKAETWERMFGAHHVSGVCSANVRSSISEHQMSTNKKSYMKPKRVRNVHCQCTKNILSLDSYYATHCKYSVLSKETCEALTLLVGLRLSRTVARLWG